MFDLGAVESEKSYTPIKPGESVEVVLEKVEVAESGDLDFYFKGTQQDNAGSFKPRYWANDFDPTNEKYNAEKAGNFMKQIKQIMEAYLTNDEVAKVKGNNAAEFFNSVKVALNPGVTEDVLATMKIIYKKGSDKDCVIPYFGSFISTAFRPRGLKLRDSVDANNIPYERVLPLSEYGVAPSAGAPVADAFGGQPSTDEVPFG